MKKFKTTIRSSKSEREASIWIYSEIGENNYQGISASDFTKEILKLGVIDILNVYINSPGGDVFDGVAIYNILKRQRAKVITHVDGFSSGVASVIAVAGNEARIAETALMVLQKPQGIVVGDARDIRKVVDDLLKVENNSIIPAFKKKTGMQEDELKKLLNAETWMNAKEAKEKGFIDEITGAKSVKAKFDFGKFNFKNQQMLQKFKIQNSKKMFLSNLEEWKWRLRIRRYKLSKNLGGDVMI